MYNGTILLPPKFIRGVYVADRYHYLFEEIASRLSWKIHIANDVSANDIDGNYLLSFKSPQHDDISRGASIPDIPKHIKVISYVVDLQHASKGSKLYDLMCKVMTRANIILCPYDEAFRRIYPQFVNKYVFFPNFFGPTSRYSNENECNRINKALVSGHLNKHFYPVRVMASQLNDVCDILPHPGYSGNTIDTSKFKVGDAFADTLRRYKCAVTCCSSLNYVLAKHFEIPAAKTIMMSDNCRDMKKIGFVPGKHFVEIVKQPNVMLNQIRTILHSNNHKNMIDNAYEFVMKNHTIEARTQQFVNMIGDI